MTTIVKANVKDDEIPSNQGSESEIKLFNLKPKLDMRISKVLTELNAKDEPQSKKKKLFKVAIKPNYVIKLFP